MYPHERSLVEKLENRPFAILGVNSDSDREKIQRICKEKNLTWRSWWDQSTSGPIARRWNVSGWPTIYVIDHKGVIRVKDVRGSTLEEWVLKLVADAEAGTQ